MKVSSTIQVLSFVTFSVLVAQAASPAQASSAKAYTSVSSISAFNKAINSSKPTIVKFSAPWCSPCRAMKPAYNKAAEQYKDIQFLEVDNDDPRVGSLFGKFNVTGMPTIIYFHKGKELFRDRKGALTKHELDTSIQKLRKQAAPQAAAPKRKATTKKTTPKKKTKKMTTQKTSKKPVKKTPKKPISKTTKKIAPKKPIKKTVKKCIQPALPVTCC